MKLLIVADGASDLARASFAALRQGTVVLQAGTVPEALAHLRRDGGIGVVLCSLAIDIGRLCAACHAERIAAPVIACGAEDDVGAITNAIRCGACNFLPLPPDADLIVAMLQAAAGETHHLIVRDPSMKRLLALIEKIAASAASILISGESGTGKEVIARHIHASSDRAGKPFIAVNCAALPEALLESELFGHERGAFTGALARRIGRFEAANGGTILLDEIGEMDIRLQAKLLRAIQERQIDRVGGTTPVPLNVRILAATNRDLTEEIAAGRFREDLYFRLNVVRLAIPPLRERPEDIAPLATHFLRHYAALNGLPLKVLAPAALERLRRHRWKGNVRELENCIHRAVLIAGGTSIEAPDLELRDDAPPAANAAPAGGAILKTLDESEQETILSALAYTLGNRTRAASILGISLRALRNKLRDYASKGVAVPPPPSGLAA